MSEKRLIDIDDLIVIAFNTENRNDIEDEFKKLPKPTLADICGTRKLDSMTEEEIKELLAMAFPKGIIDCIIEFSEERHLHYNISITDYDYNTWYVAIDMGGFSAVSTEGEDTIYVHPTKLVKWFIEKGFKVF